MSSEVTCSFEGDVCGNQEESSWQGLRYLVRNVWRKSMYVLAGELSTSQVQADWSPGDYTVVLCWVITA